MIRSFAFLPALAAACVLVGSSAPAQQPLTQIHPPPPSAGGEVGRFSFNIVNDGLIRLDSRTGQISHCRRRGPGWSCETVADDRAALEAEIERLTGQVASSKAEIAWLSGKIVSLEADLARRMVEPTPRPAPAPPHAVPAPEVPPKQSLKPPAHSPADDELERAMRYLENLFRRFLTMVDRLRREVEPGRT